MTDPIIAAARFLLSTPEGSSVSNLEFLRHHPEADEVLTTIDACARVVAGIARGPAPQRYLGPCGAEIEEPECNPIRRAPDCPEDCGTLKFCDGDIYARE